VGALVAEVPRALRSRQDSGRWSRRRGHPAGRVDRTGSRGKGRGGSLTLAGLQLPFPSTCMHFVKGDSYPAQRNAKDGEFLLSGLARRGGSRLLFFGFGYCTDAVYMLLRSGRQKREQNK